MRVVIVDNFDSYTNNLALLVASLTGVRPWVVRNDVSLAALRAYDPEAIILSAGPGNPEVAGGVCRAVIEAFTSTPILGVCLGHQLIALHFGGRIERLAEPRHGTTVSVTHDGSGVFAGLPQGFLAMRYHSLTVRTTLVETATGDGEVLGLRHRTRPLFGVQFHPESVASEYGRELLASFLGLRFEAAVETTLPADAALLHEAVFGDCETSFLLRHPERHTFLGTGKEATSGSARRAVSAGFPFGTGLAGVIGYDGHARFLEVTRSLVIDGNRVFALESGANPEEAKQKARAWKRELEAMQLQPKPVVQGSTSGAFVVDRASYEAKIQECFELIRAGECYELCLTNRFEGETSYDAWTLFRRLQARNPAPYSALFRFFDCALIMASPERLVRITDGVAQTRPIKGTRARGATSQEDQAQRLALATSEKDRRENLMIVDVSRHDLGSVSDAVTVTELLKVEAHPTVWQLVSTVTARLNTSAEQAVAALMPPASMTGAPKARAVELLQTLEPSPRGMYAGAAGYFSASGDADFAVVIRSLVLAGRKVRFGVGGAIVLGSDPRDEWDEAMLKARALLDTLDCAGAIQ